MAIRYVHVRDVCNHGMGDPNDCVIFGLSTDEKPSNTLGVCFIEVDTGKIYKVGQGVNWTPPPAGSSSGPPAYTDFVQNLGVGRSGTFDITGLSGLTPNKVVHVVQSPTAILSKGSATDEMEFDTIHAGGWTVNESTIRVSWKSTGIAAGDYNFSYLISG